MPREINNGRLIRLSSTHSEPYSAHGHALYFGSGREAVLSLARSVGKPSGNVVLLPAYVPEGLFRPFELDGWKIVLYQVDSDLDPLWESLVQLLDEKRAQIAVIIHYFGLHKDAERFSDACHRRGTLVLEDMAHVLPGYACACGRAGDFILYSPGKCLGVPDGGVLVCRSSIPGLQEPRMHFDPRRSLYLSQQLSLLLMNFVSRRIPAGWWLRMLRGVSRVFMDSYRSLMSYFHDPHRASWMTRYLLRHTDWDSCSMIRAKHARSYASGLDAVVFRQFRGSLAAGGGPYGYPVRVRDRDGLRLYLRRHGISGAVLDTHWDFIPHHTQETHHREAKRVLAEHFLFPVNHDLSSEEVATVISVANQWAKIVRQSINAADS